MKISCKYCGRIHDKKEICVQQSKVIKNRQSKFKSSEKEKFRKTKSWQKKAIEIKERDTYLCTVCRKKTFNTIKQYNYDNLEVHHIIPLVEDYELRLEDDNLITLCRFHHELAEKGYITREYLRSILKTNKVTNVKLNIIYGPPCSGKTTYVKNNMNDGDIVIDYDYIKQAITYKDIRDAVDRELIQMINSIKQFILDNPIGNTTVWLITTRKNENVDMYANVETIVMNKSKEDCINYLMNDDSRKDKESQRKAIEQWFGYSPLIQ